MFTAGHAHGVTSDVKGDIALGNIFYCVQHVVEPEIWPPVLVKTAFCSLNGGLWVLFYLFRELVFTIN